MCSLSAASRVSTRVRGLPRPRARPCGFALGRKIQQLIVEPHSTHVVALEFLVPRRLCGLQFDAAPSRALGLTRLRRDALFSLFSFGCSSLGLAAARSKAAVVVVLRLRRMGRSVTTRTWRTSAKVLTVVNVFIFFQPNSAEEAAATSNGLTRMIANGLPSGANAAMAGPFFYGLRGLHLK